MIDVVYRLPSGVIGAARVRAGVKQLDLAEMLGMKSSRYWSHVERGDRPLTEAWLPLLPEAIRHPVRDAMIAELEAKIEELRAL